MDSEAPGGAGLWDETVHGFRGAVLQRAILARGWTVSDFARAAHVHPAAVYNALNGSRARASTAIRIFETLEKRQPMSVAIA